VAVLAAAASATIARVAILPRILIVLSSWLRAAVLNRLGAHRILMRFIALPRGSATSLARSANVFKPRRRLVATP